MRSDRGQDRGTAAQPGLAVQDLSARVDDLGLAGVDLLRLYPQLDGFEQVIERFEGALGGNPVQTADGSVEGYWLGEPGMHGATDTGESLIITAARGTSRDSP